MLQPRHVGTTLGGGEWGVGGTGGSVDTSVLLLCFKQWEKKKKKGSQLGRRDTPPTPPVPTALLPVLTVTTILSVIVRQ